MEYLGDGAAEMPPVEMDIGNLGPLASLAAAELPGCDDLILRQQLGFALREFCRETDACTDTAEFRWLCGAETPRGRSFTVSCAPSGMEVGTVLGVSGGGIELPYEVSGCDGCGCAEVLVLRRPFGDDGSVRIRFSLWPKAGGESCPRRFAERYAEAIVAGAMYHMLSMSGRAWSDAQRAAQYMAKYHDAISEASYRRMCGGAAAGCAASAVPQGGGLFL